MKYALKSGSKTVTTAGTRVALSTTDVWARGLRLAPPAANAGAVFVGDVTVSASNGLNLAAGVVVPFSDLFGKSSEDLVAVNLKNCYVDAATNGDKLSFAWLEEVL